MCYAKNKQSTKNYIYSGKSNSITQKNGNNKSQKFVWIEKSYRLICRRNLETAKIGKVDCLTDQWRATWIVGIIWKRFGMNYNRFYQKFKSPVTVWIKYSAFLQNNENGIVTVVHTAK